ncbi:MAG: hypothetical protein JHC26_01570 [Thermofilum sp.]|jgi:hypothetical protein|uniref:hypothetical protein n=1 Tax=Thermofilum sp. TaxID=1961369 RepID=UPI00258560B9|nr:hypothetical protein [Thermofilum sp.]MCI4407750.1 hypothetical protein [Thermofilum sp.]
MPYWVFLFDSLTSDSRVYVWKALRRACGGDWRDKCLELLVDGYTEISLREFIELAKSDNSRIYVSPEFPWVKPEVFEKLLEKYKAIDIGLIARELDK